MDKHAGFVKELLTSWTPQCSEPRLALYPFREDWFTREGFADVLRHVGTIAEERLQGVEDRPSGGDCGTDHRIQYQLMVVIHDWDAQKEWWEDHIKSCFPTWLDLGRLNWRFNPRKCASNSISIATDLTF